MFPLYKQELKQLARGYSSPVLALFGVFAGAVIGFGVSWATASFSDPRAEMKIAVGFYVSIAMTLITASLSIRDWYVARQIVKDIEKETIEVDVLGRCLMWLPETGVRYRNTSFQKWSP